MTLSQHLLLCTCHDIDLSPKSSFLLLHEPENKTTKTHTIKQNKQTLHIDLIFGEFRSQDHVSGLILEDLVQPYLLLSTI